jgi:murein L,D-transpeptidase YcbB/YkuD
MTGADVAVVQRKLGITPTGIYDAETVSRVKGVQFMAGKKTTGNVDAETAEALGTETPDSNPDWFTSPIDSMFREGEDVREARRLLGLGDRDNRWDADAEAACRRFQGTNGLPVTGFVDVETARALA